MQQISFIALVMKMLRMYMLEKVKTFFFLVIHQKWLMKRFSVKMDAF